MGDEDITEWEDTLTRRILNLINAVEITWKSKTVWKDKIHV